MRPRVKRGSGMAFMGWWVCSLGAALLLDGCGSTRYSNTPIEEVGFLERAVSATEGVITVRAALPTAAETLALTGLDLYSQGIQPLWIEVHNGSAEDVRAALWSIDRDYFSPLEVAYMNKGKYRGEAFHELERWLHGTALGRRIPKGETRSGFMYTNLTPGTKGFNLDLYSLQADYNFTLFLDLPGFTPDYRMVDLANLYAEDDIREVTAEQALTLARGQFPCCASDATGTSFGRPLNMVFIATPTALRRSLMRGAWRETSAQQRQALFEERDYFRGRPADGRFYLRRPDGNVELVLSTWLAPWRLDGVPVWVAQAYYREVDQPLVAALRRSGALEGSEMLSRFAGEAISADVDSAQRFVVQNLWYNQSVLRAAFFPVMEARDEDTPGVTHDGYGYVTRGTRAVVELSEQPTAFGDAQILRAPDNPDSAASRVDGP